ncbi:TIGR03618 family F420-dependent PPOX class oxidoreductase [uncultured Jatrophihabitans sp.]|uniref:TIGR03618 family F420-dependent PPOX class oxidoreductase n=1 Tax=uncultured Jatrophihabitans sp. TaxID=1610747 RepID=UPI0035CBEC06
MTSLQSFAELARAASGLTVVSTQRPDSSLQASVVNTGVLDGVLDDTPVVGFVTYGKVKLANLRVNGLLALTVRDGWHWATVEGRATIIGPYDPHVDIDAERLRLLLREVFAAAGGEHDDWDDYDRTMARERRSVVLVAPSRVYGN